MRNLLTACWLLLLATAVSAQTYPVGSAGGTAYDGGAVTNPFLAPTGCASPGYSFTDETDMGVCRNGAGDVRMTGDTIGDGTANGYVYANGSSATLWFEDGLGNNSYLQVTNGSGNGAITMTEELGHIFSFSSVGTSSTTPFLPPYGSQAARGREAGSGIHFPATLQATFGTYTSTGSYTAEFRASSSGAVGKATVYAADGGNSAQIDVYTTYAEMVGGLLGTNVDLQFEGSTDNTWETTLTAEDPTADRIATLPNITGVVEVEPSSSGALTDAANKTLLNCDCSWNWPSPVDRLAGTVEVTAYATDATDYQLTTLTLEYVVQCDSASTAAVTTALVPSTHTTATSSGTLTCTAFDSNSGGNITVGVNCDTSLTATTFTGKWQHNVRDRTCVDNGGGSYQ